MFQLLQAERATTDPKQKLILKEEAWDSDRHNTKFEHWNNATSDTVCVPGSSSL